MSAGSSKKKKLNILFVCTGNTCRSPIAEAAFSDLIQRSEMGHLVEVSSAGLMARDGASASSLALQVSSDKGLDLSSHRSRQITEEIIDRADMIFGMQPTHLMPLQQLIQDTGKEYLLLGSFHPDKAGDSDYYIDDPFGGSREEYEKVYDTILACMENLLAYVKSCLSLESGNEAT